MPAGVSAGDGGDSPSELTVTPKTITVVSEITASVTAGENVTMKGSNFNMIEAIYLGESKVTSFVSRSDTEIVFTVPAAVVPGTYYPEFVLTTGERENSPRAVEVQGAVADVLRGEANAFALAVHRRGPRHDMCFCQLHLQSVSVYKYNISVKKVNDLFQKYFFQYICNVITSFFRKMSELL